MKQLLLLLTITMATLTANAQAKLYDAFNLKARTTIELKGKTITDFTDDTVMANKYKSKIMSEWATKKAIENALQGIGVDTNLLATRLRLYKVKDSLSAIINSKLSIADTTNKWVSKNHTINNISNGTGFLKNNGSGTWSWDNSSYVDLAGSQTITGGKTTTNLLTINADNLGTTQDYTKGLMLSNTTAATVSVPNQYSPALVFNSQIYGYTTNSFTGNTNGSFPVSWKLEQRPVSGESYAWNNRLVFSRKEHNGSWVDIGEFNKDGFVGNISGNSITLGNIGNEGAVNVRRSSDGGVNGLFRAESEGATIRSGNSVIYMKNIGGVGRISFGNGNPNDGMRYEGSSGLYITKVGTAHASPNSRLVVDANVTIGENVAAPTNGLRVVGNTLLQAKTFLGGTTTPTALLHLDKNQSTAGNAPIKFTLDGAALLATPERGALEAMPYRLHFTDSSNQRNTLAYLSDVYKTPMNVADSNYTVVGNEIIIGFTGLTADRTCTLPNPASHAGKSLTLFAKGMNDYDLNFSSSYKPKNLNDSTITSVKGDLPKHGVDTGSAIEGVSMKLVSFNNEWVILNYFTHYK